MLIMGVVALLHLTRQLKGCRRASLLLHSQVGKTL